MILQVMRGVNAEMDKPHNIKDELKFDFLESYTVEEINEELKRISKIAKGRPISKKDIIKYGRVSYPTICRKFGGLSKAIIAAGLNPNTSYHHNISNEELLNSLIDLWSQTLNKEGRRPEKNDLKRYGIPFHPIPIIDVLEAGERHLSPPITSQVEVNYLLLVKQTNLSPIEM